MEGYGDAEGGIYPRDEKYHTVSLRSHANPLKSGLRTFLIVADIVPPMMAKI
jgi:hypothetical protein